MLECKNKNSFGIGMQKGLQKQQVHIFTSHIGHIKLAYYTGYKGYQGYTDHTGFTCSTDYTGYTGY